MGELHATLRVAWRHPWRISLWQLSPWRLSPWRLSPWRLSPWRRWMKAVHC